MNAEQMKEFKEISDRMICFLIENGHPHMTIIIDQTHAELLEGVATNVRD